MFKGTVMQIEKAQINGGLCVSKVSWNFTFQLLVILSRNLPVKFVIFLKVAYFLTVSIFFSVST